LERGTEKRNKVPILVAIVGGSGSGKSWLADELQRKLGACAARISLDDFYIDRSQLSLRRRAAINFDHPRAIDWPAVELVMQDWLAGRAVRVPCYDFKTHCRAGASRVLQAKPILLVEGLWLLRRYSMRRLFDLRIFINCPQRVRLRRRLERDVRARGRTESSVREQFRKTVEPMHRKFVESQLRWADVVLTGQCDKAEVRKLAARIIEHMK
jgi:uridine kinase